MTGLYLFLQVPSTRRCGGDTTDRTPWAAIGTVNRRYSTARSGDLRDSPPRRARCLHLAWGVGLQPLLRAGEEERTVSAFAADQGHFSVAYLSTVSTVEIVSSVAQVVDNAFRSKLLHGFHYMPETLHIRLR